MAEAKKKAKVAAHAEERARRLFVPPPPPPFSPSPFVDYHGRPVDGLKLDGTETNAFRMVATPLGQMRVAIPKKHYQRMVRELHGESIESKRPKAKKPKTKKVGPGEGNP